MMSIDRNARSRTLLLCRCIFSRSVGLLLVLLILNDILLFEELGQRE